jgi:tRNA(Ile)-lysidine synthase
MADEPLDYPALDSQLEPLLDAPRWYVGFSGGLDSTVLLHLLQHWCRHHPAAPPLSAIHVNHGLQDQSDEWQVHCQWTCRLLQIPLLCFQASVTTGSRGLEAAAREARYSLFEQHLQAGDVLFLGHHADDQVETFFLRLLRGSGVRGLAAMPARRALAHGRLARPLLSLPRAVLETYASSHGLSCVEDPSNSDIAMDRNFLRREVLPLLAQRWPGYRGTVGRASEHIAAAADLLTASVPAPPTVFSEMGDPGVRLSELLGRPPEEMALALRHWLQAAGLPAPERAALAEFQRQLDDMTPDSRPRLHCSAYTLQRYQDAVYLLPGTAAPDSDETASLVPQQVLQLPAEGGRLWLSASTVAGLKLATTDQLQVKWRRGGERCRPHGRGAGASLKKLLQDSGVPPWWRDRVPLLFLDGELLAVGDLWLCESPPA